jgi:uncharacterized integral membrane protein
MKILARALFVLFVVMAMLVALSNSQPVELALWPLPHVLFLPLYLLVVGLLLVGILVGLGIGWWSGRHYRRRARERGTEAARLEREVVRLRDALTANQPAPRRTPPGREQKSAERQAALVTPDLLPPTTRSPSA